MLVFNDLSGGDNYPSLVVHFENGRERIIKNVSFFAVHGESVRASVHARKKDIGLKNVAYVTVTHYKYRLVEGVATVL